MKDKELEKLKIQHFESYRKAILCNLENNSNTLFNEDIYSLIKKPPLDSMDNIKTNTTEIKKEDSYNFDIPNPNSNTINAGNYHRRSSLFKPDQLKDLIKKKVIIQPQMRFSARTDLERVFDAINEK